jgi:hypothetical protein
MLVKLTKDLALNSFLSVATSSSLRHGDWRSELQRSVLGQPGKEQNLVEGEAKGKCHNDRVLTSRL